MWHGVFLLGFVALAPDLYHGKSTSEPDEARKLAQSCGGDDETARPAVLVAGFAVGAVECVDGADGGDAGWRAVLAVSWPPAPSAEWCEPLEPKRQLAVASWAETVHWLRFVIDQTLLGGVDSDYLGVRRARCQLCGHVGPLVRPVLATNGIR